MSFPLFGDTLTFTQPDGTKFNARGWGDQNSARFETMDGYELVYDRSTGFYHYATTTPEGDEIRSMGARVGIDVPPPNTLSKGPLLHPKVDPMANASHSELPASRWRERLQERQASERLHLLSQGVTPAPPSRSTVGDYLGLCLLIDFSDAPATIAREQVDAFCNEVGYGEFTNNGSVYDYFLENSDGRLSYKTLVAPYYRAKFPKTYYTDVSVTFGERTRDLIKEALAFHTAQGFDFSKLTTDPQNGVYATNVFYAGPVVNNWKFGLWPHASRLLAPFPLSENIFSVDYQITAMGNELTLGTYCHENGHMLCDFPDLYQYSNQALGVGKFCLMCLGGNANLHNPVRVGAYLRYRAGWSREVVLDAGTKVVIADSKGNQVFIHSKGDGEYFLIENRQRLGRDSALPASGLAVWHIDELGSNSEPQTAPLGHRRHECVLIQADGLTELDDGRNAGDPGDLFQPGPSSIFSDTALPSSRWWSDAPSGLQVAAIAVDNGQVTFSATVGADMP